MIIDKLIEKIRITENPSVAGLDPKLEYVPEHIRAEMLERYGVGTKAAAKAVLKFNKRLIDAIYDIVPAIKPQVASKRRAAIFLLPCRINNSFLS